MSLPSFQPPESQDTETSSILPAVPILTYYPAWPSEYYRRWHWIKRVLDVIISAIGLMLLLPLFGGVAVLIKLSSKGPILFQQERLSIHEQPFTLIKFRTMIHEAEAKTGATWVQENDNRITKIGHFLRKTHLDEMPQLWNVLKGEMSLIGPRPERPVFVKQFRDQKIGDYSCRHFFRPGITGYAQMLNPNPTIDQIQDKTDADLWYVSNWSPKVELWLVKETAAYFCKSLFKLILSKKQKNSAAEPSRQYSAGHGKA
jgi:lipopolysaccharide/colanic/teichoic acid biosynthesis glycosyltransferase